MKLGYGKLLSNFGFNFILCRYRLAGASREQNPEGAAAASVAAALQFSHGVAEAGPSP